MYLTQRREGAERSGSWQSKQETAPDEKIGDSRCRYNQDTQMFANSNAVQGPGPRRPYWEDVCGPRFGRKTLPGITMNPYDESMDENRVEACDVRPAFNRYSY